MTYLNTCHFLPEASARRLTVILPNIIVIRLFCIYRCYGYFMYIIRSLLHTVGQQALNA